MHLMPAWLDKDLPFKRMKRMTMQSPDTSYRVDPVLGLPQQELSRSSQQHQGDATAFYSPEDRTETGGQGRVAGKGWCLPWLPVCSSTAQNTPATAVGFSRVPETSATRVAPSRCRVNMDGLPTPTLLTT